MLRAGKRREAIMSVRLILVGCGNMGHAMLDGWLRSGRLVPAEVIVVEPNEALRERAGRLGAGTAATASELPAGIDPTLVVFAVKPQVMRAVVPDYRRFAEKAAFLSIAAGVPIATMQDILGDRAAIIRCMPPSARA
jgi:pyrroline-5-carboxylate reductase